jgi:hypothetical protein
MAGIIEQRSQSGHGTAEEALSTAERLGKVAYMTGDDRYLCVPASCFEAREAAGVPMVLLARHHEGGVVRDYRNRARGR